MKVYLSTLGCKLNESEVEAWARRFANEGHQVVADPATADYIVLNTCTVTHVAARKSRQLARQLARANPNAKLALTGCYVSVSPDQAKALPNVALVVPNVDKDRLVQIADSQWRAADSQPFDANAIDDMPYAISQHWLDADVETQAAGARPQESPISNLQSHVLRTRVFVKIEDGCNMSCTYCIIPIARGKERSRPLADVVGEVASLVDAGYKEIILTGVQISSYRDHKPGFSPSRKPGLYELTSTILAETNVPRLRLTSIAPWELDQSLLELFSDSRLCRHLHLSLQSGSDTVLRRMRRPYTTAQFARAVELTRAKIPDVGITTDVIVGFPGESEVEFEQSLEFVDKMRFSRVHVFPYSARSGTIAATQPLQVADAVKESRVKQMQAVADASMQAFAERFIGREMAVLWETQEKDEVGRMKDEGGRMKDEGGTLRVKDEIRESQSNFHPSSFILHPSLWSGYTDNYIRVIAPSDSELTNRITSARLIKPFNGGIIGEVIRKVS